MNVINWATLDLGSRPPRRPVACGGTLSTESVLAAACSGVFVMPSSGPQRELARILYEDDVKAGMIADLSNDGDLYSLCWWCPEPRFTIPGAAVRLRKKQRSLIRRIQWRSTANSAFDHVVERCRVGREPRWITDELKEVLIDLHRKGWAYSVEVWEGNEMVGGAFGLAFGSVMSVDSHFHARSEASKIAMVDIASRGREAGITTVDLQWQSAHGADVGGEETPREEFLRLCGESARRPVRFPCESRPLTWLTNVGRLESRAGSES